MAPLAIFDGQALIPFEARAVRRQVLAHAFDPVEFSRVVLNLFLYDQVVIPTVDFAAVPAMILAIGPDNFHRYLSDGTIQFVRYRGTVGYVGAGNGLEFIEIRSPLRPPPGEKPDRTWLKTSGENADEVAVMDAASSDLDEALDLTMDAFHLDEVLGEDTTELRRLVLTSTVEPPRPLLTRALEQSYRDVLAHPPARTLFAMRNSNLKRLLGLDGTQVRLLDRALWNDEIDVLLHLAQFNVESALATELSCSDQTAGPSAVGFDAAHRRVSRQEAFQTMRRIARLPDFSVLHALDDDAPLNDVLRIRDSRLGSEFRVWFHAAVIESPDDAISRLIVELTTKDGAFARFTGVASIFVKTVLSAVISSAATFTAGPAAGAAAGALPDLIEGFLLPLVRRPSSPARLVIAELRNTLPAGSTSHSPSP